MMLREVVGCGMILSEWNDSWGVREAREKLRFGFTLSANVNYKEGCLYIILTSLLLSYLILSHLPAKRLSERLTPVKSS